MIVDLNPTEDQRLIVDTVETLLSRALPVQRLRHSASFGAGSERGIWSDLVELGLFGFGLTESAGGIGYGLPEEILAARSFGRYCVSPTVIATMVGVHGAAAHGEIALRDALRTGTARAAFANPLGDGDEMHLVDADGCDWFVILGAPLRLVARSAMRVAPL